MVHLETYSREWLQKDFLAVPNYSTNSIIWHQCPLSVGKDVRYKPTFARLVYKNQTDGLGQQGLFPECAQQHVRGR